MTKSRLIAWGCVVAGTAICLAHPYAVLLGLPMMILGSLRLAKLYLDL